MVNLKNAKKMHNDLYTPLKGFLDFYDLTNQHIVKNQVKMAKSFGIRGFSVYYYWFSENSITGNNMLMSNAIDNFFNESYDKFDVFFIWANESWSNNVHFNVNSNNHIISNIYNKINIKKNIDNLITYFKHNNYKKINNKPVLFLHNPDQLSISELDLFYDLLNETCIINGFHGVEFVVYDRGGIYIKKYQTYVINPRGKSGSHITFKNNIYYTNYKNQVIDYIKDDNSNVNVNGVLINYDNTARLFTHNNTHKHITRFYNSDINEFYILLNYCLHKYLYKKQSISKIFLINAWNEWGEKMTAEPSNEIGFLYLNTIQSSLLHLLNGYTQQKQSIDNKIIVNDLNINSINIKYKYILFDEFLKLDDTEQSNYEFLLIDYVRLPIISYKHFCEDLYKTKEDTVYIENKIINTKLIKILLIHDLHDYTFDDKFVGFFNYCTKIKIDYISSLYSDNYEFKIIKSNMENRGIGIYVIPHLIDETIYHSYNESKIYDIIFYGTVSDNCYAFRKRLLEIIQKYKIQYRWKVRVISYNELTTHALSKEINKAYIAIASRSSYDYFLMKYIEIGLSNTLIAGDIPTQSTDYFKNIINLTENMSDIEITTILHNNLNDKQALLHKIRQQSNDIKYLQLKYKNYYYNMLFDKIMKTPTIPKEICFDTHDESIEQRLEDGLITFIIPTINRPALINTLLSLKSQKIDNWKAIVIFDGCIPSDVRLLDLLSDKHFTHFSIDKVGTIKGIKHGMAGYVRNIGMDLVNTQWIGFVDDDDVLLPDYTEKLLEEIMITPHADLILFRMIHNEMIPSIDVKTIEVGHVGISFCFKTELYKRGFKFKQSEREDFNLIKDIQHMNHKIVISPYITYRVKNSNINYKNAIRVIIN